MVSLSHFLLSVVIASFLALAACSQVKKPDGSIRVEEATDSVVSGNQEKVVDLLGIQGVWWVSDGDPSALFFIAGDSLYYVDEQESPYFLTLKEDTLRMLRGHAVSSFVVLNLTTDSLVIFDPAINERIILFKKE